MKTIENIFQAIVVLIIGVILFGALGMGDLASQIGSLSILIILVSVIVILFKLIKNII